MKTEKSIEKTKNMLKSILELGQELIQKTFEDPEEAEDFGEFAVYKIVDFIQRTAEGDREPRAVQAEASVLMMYLKGLAESGLRLTIEKVGK